MGEPLTLLSVLADVGIPMIAFTLPAMIILLIPIIAVEAFLCKKWLQLTWWQAMKSNALSNIASTLVGVPLAWASMLGFAFAVLESIGPSTIDKLHSPLAYAVFFFLGSAWIGPTDTDTLWMVPAATLCLLIPFYFASYGIEYFIVAWIVGMPEGGPPNLSYPRVRAAVRNANLVTYGLMFLATSVWLIFTLPHR